MDTRLKGMKGFMTIKLDMSKAYNIVECDYLEALMRKLGFVERWIHLLMVCVRTITYYVLINGFPHWHIIPTRGLRQVDPLSPYLFLLCAEGLSSFVQEAERNQLITGLPIFQGGLKLSYLFFADDNILFRRATCME